MAYTEFLNRTGEILKCIVEKISKDKDKICRRLIVEYDKISVEKWAITISEMGWNRN